MIVSVLGFLLLVCLLAGYELQRLRRSGASRRDMLAFFIMVALAAALGAAMIAGRPVPNPRAPIDAIFKPLADRIVPPEHERF